MPEIGGVQVPFLPAGGVKELRRTPVTPSNDKVNSSFDTVFQEELSRLKFSGHAKTRMNSRDIQLTNTEMLRLENAVDKAESKGAKESLVIMDEKAFIVSVNNKTVITMINKDQLEENVITKIDSAVFA